MKRGLGALYGAGCHCGSLHTEVQSRVVGILSYPTSQVLEPYFTVCPRLDKEGPEPGERSVGSSPVLGSTVSGQYCYRG